MSWPTLWDISKAYWQGDASLFCGVGRICGKLYACDFTVQLNWTIQLDRARGGLNMSNHSPGLQWIVTQTKDFNSVLTVRKLNYNVFPAF